MSEIAVEIWLYCGDCGEEIRDLDYTDAVRSKKHGVPSFRVPPCPRCLEAARDEGREEGRKENV